VTELDRLPTPTPSFWQGIRLLTLHSLHESVLSRVGDWVRSSRLEAEQGASAQAWGLEHLDIDLVGTSDMRLVLAKFSTPGVTELHLIIALAVQLDSSFISYVAELFPSIKRLVIVNADGRSYARDVVSHHRGRQSKPVLT
jgi:hypothetical protein